MQTTYRLNSKELNENFIKSIQDMYQNKEIELTVTVVEDESENLQSDNRRYDFSDLSGGLVSDIDPLAYQRAVRNEWK